MGLFGAKKELKAENNSLQEENNKLIEWQKWAQQRIAWLESNASPDMKKCDSLMIEIEKLKKQPQDEKIAVSGLQKEKELLEKQRTEIASEIEKLESKLTNINDDILVQEFGLYEPRYDFKSIEQYKVRLKEIREKQKHEIKEMNQKVKGSSKWVVNGSASEGRKMASDISRLLMTAFNSACDDIIRRVKFSNINKSIELIEKQAAKISKYGRVMDIEISPRYVELKSNEARLQYEYSLFKEKEKERMRELREQEREAKKLAKEIAEQRKKLDKERKQYQKELDVVLKQLQESNGEKLEALTKKKIELESELSEIKKAKEDVDYREANQKAGYVYVISNIGAFGEGVYKIGMTRRLDPMERVRELGDASVPFNFDVHAMIFSEDAPALEAALHRAFGKRKMNLVNQRREFFRCSIDEIKNAILKNYDETVEFIDIPDAEQYRISEKMRESL